MKKIHFFLFFIIGNLLLSQVKNDTKTFVGIQAGFLGTNIYAESNISKQFSIRSELNLMAGIWGGDLYSRTGFALSPELSVAPKWYYNLNDRSKENKNIRYNSANYLSAKISFVPDWFIISNIDDIRVNSMISLIPTWGFRRNFSKKFNYEFQVGLGVGKILESNYDLQVIPNLSFKLGYDF